MDVGSSFRLVASAWQYLMMDVGSLLAASVCIVGG